MAGIYKSEFELEYEDEGEQPFEAPCLVEDLGPDVCPPLCGDVEKGSRYTEAQCWLFFSGDPIPVVVHSQPGPVAPVPAPAGGPLLLVSLALVVVIREAGRRLSG